MTSTAVVAGAANNKTAGRSYYEQQPGKCRELASLAVELWYTRVVNAECL